MAYTKPRPRASGPASLRYFLYVRKSSEPGDRQVLSIESQRSELRRAYGNLNIIETIEEAKSAKSPGRPLFERMMARIEAGEADGLIAWHPDRLSRNSVDGGRVIHDLDRGLLRDLKFAQYTFENTPEGKWMLGIILGQSKYFVDKLSKDVKRGIATKLELGWMPGRVPLGYLNHRDTATGMKTVIEDPQRFSLVQQMWTLMLGGHSPTSIRNIAVDEWGLRSVKRARSGGLPLTMSAVYRILNSPFYFGQFEHNGVLVQGRHTPMISEEQFWQVQKILGRHGRRRPKVEKGFAFTGLIRCGECGAMVTAEEKHKTTKGGQTYTYVYYHCTKKKPGIRCSQRCVEVKSLESQIDSVLESISVDEEFVKWADTHMQNQATDMIKAEQVAAESIEQSLRSLERQLDSLMGMRVRDLITDREFDEKRYALTHEIHALERRKADGGTGETARTVEKVHEIMKLALVARYQFQNGDAATKRHLLEIVGSNRVLHDKRLHLEPEKPFVYLQNASNKNIWQGIVKDVRTWVINNPDINWAI